MSEMLREAGVLLAGSRKRGEAGWPGKPRKSRARPADAESRNKGNHTSYRLNAEEKMWIDGIRRKKPRETKGEIFTVSEAERARRLGRTAAMADCATCALRKTCERAQEGSYCTRWTSRNGPREGKDPNQDWIRGEDFDG